MIKKYKTKPQLVEAVQFDGSNVNEISDFLGGDKMYISLDKESDCDYLECSEFGPKRIYKGSYVVNDGGKYFIMASHNFYTQYDEAVKPVKKLTILEEAFLVRWGNRPGCLEAYYDRAILMQDNISQSIITNWFKEIDEEGFLAVKPNMTKDSEHQLSMFNEYVKRLKEKA